VRLVTDWRGLGPELKGASVALGNFDGVHRGHQLVIDQAVMAAAHMANVPVGVISFEPHPRRWFQPDAEPFRLMTLNQQARALEGQGVDLFYVLPFDAQMAAMTDEAFAKQVLAEGLGVRHVAAGFDITFGKGRTGDPGALRHYGELYGFAVSIAQAMGDEEAEKYSSSAVRAALQAGQPERAAVILGRPFAIEGVVVTGQKLGRTLGFPTANVELQDYVRPRLGVYATRTRLADGRWIDGVSNLGRNPTTGLVKARLETWLFDFNEDLYGQMIETQLIGFLRPEARFDGLEALIAQIAADASNARTLLSGLAD
jgi:riboflavin kinase/FMN adenylyltransferase